jgi:hypothetical protein
LRRPSRTFHIAVAGVVARVAGATATISADDEIVEAVAVDVAGRRYGIAGSVVHILPMDDKAVEPMDSPP